MSREYEIMGEKLFKTTKLPAIRPEHVRAFLRHMQGIHNKTILMQEIFAGTAGVSLAAHRGHLITLPPIDYIYGWDLHRKDHQRVLLELTAFFKPAFSLMEFYCRPWSQSNNNSDPACLEHRRDYERPLLTGAVQEYLPR
eukprot:9380581-Pyramimonas_sp.AAC.1